MHISNKGIQVNISSFIRFHDRWIFFEAIYPILNHK